MPYIKEKVNSGNSYRKENLAVFPNQLKIPIQAEKKKKNGKTVYEKKMGKGGKELCSQFKPSCTK